MINPLWQPSAEVIKNANVTAFIHSVNQQHQAGVNDYNELQAWSVLHIDQFWQAVADFCQVKMSGKAKQVVDDANKLPGAKWFEGATLNFAENLLAPAKDSSSQSKPALIFRCENGERKSVTYEELYDQVSRLSQAFQQEGIQAGDRVVGVMPNCIETIIAMLAATSLGAIWSSCSPDFGINGIVDRFHQVEPKLMIAVDGYFYGGKEITITDRIKTVQEKIPSLQKTILIPFLNIYADVGGLSNTVLLEKYLVDYTPAAIEFTQLPFDHPLYIMYSSGTTGVPKCIVHSAGGTLLQHRKEHALNADLKQNDVFFYFTTCGWMMWNWLVTGLASGATLVLYDGSPFHPKPEVLIDMIDEESITHFGTSAKYISALEKADVKPKNSHKLEKLRAVFSTGSPLAHESFDYIYRDFKQDVCLSSISGGTDIVSCFALGSVTLPVYRGELQCIGLGMDVHTFDDDGKPVTQEKGELVCTSAFPSCPIGFWNDADGKRFHSAYFDRFEGVWAHGDYAEITERGTMIIYGRSDSVLNPGGVRIGTAEIYRQVEKLEYVLESVAVGQSWQDDVRVILFVRLRDGVKLDEDLIKEIKTVIRTNTTPRHVPAKVIQIDDIPRTISGKIAEVAVRNVIHRETVKNTDALANPESLALYVNLPELQD